MRQDYVKGKFTYSDIFHTMQSMLIAAIDTTSTQAAIVWSNLARWPEWQERASISHIWIHFDSNDLSIWPTISLTFCKKIVRDEVDNIPLSQIRKWDDVPKLAAFMYETIRWNPAVFRNLYHTATREIECAGYTFGKDTLFSYNIAGQRSSWSFIGPKTCRILQVWKWLKTLMISDKAVSMNEKYFPEPFKFDPNRFLSDDGSLKEPVLNYRKHYDDVWGFNNNEPESSVTKILCRLDMVKDHAQVPQSLNYKFSYFLLMF